MKYFNILMLTLILSACALTDARSGDAAPVWIDVRTAAEFSSGHLDGAVNIPHREIAERIAEISGGKDTDIHLYCGSGARAEIARKTLRDMGYHNVTNDGGYRDLVAAGKQAAPATE